MKRTIHPANVAEGDLVEFTQNDCLRGIFIPMGTKAKFLEWIDSSGAEFALASVIPIGVEIQGWVWTSPDILVVEE